jgi:hypothetical protein
MYTLLYMATRTQIYLTEEQRAGLDELGRREKKKLAELIRQAVDDYLAEKRQDLQAALNQTFGLAPDASFPSRDEWEHRG